MSGFIRVVNWDKMQHYKDRSPPWIKLHRDLLTSETWVSSSNDDRVLAIAIMMLAADTDNRIPASPRYIQRRAYLDNAPDLSGLLALNFIEIIEEKDDASTPLADARPEGETEGEGEQNSVTNVTAPEAPPVDPEKVMFDSGVSFLAGSGIPPAKARPLLGRWKRDHGAGAVIEALGAAQRHGAIDPISFIEGRFKSIQRAARASDEDLPIC